MKDIDWEEVKQSLRHVLWIGGAQCGGKSTLSKRISDDYGIILYAGDEEGRKHIGKVTSENAPIWHGMHQKGGVIWLWDQNLETMTKFWNGMGEEDLRFVIDDLLEMPTNKPILVDLFNGYPEWIRKIANREKVMILKHHGPDL